MAVAAVFLLALIGVAVLQNIGLRHSGQIRRDSGKEPHVANPVSTMDRLYGIVAENGAARTNSADPVTIIGRLVGVSESPADYGDGGTD